MNLRFVRTWKNMEEEYSKKKNVLKYDEIKPIFKKAIYTVENKKVTKQVVNLD